jgi:hypothetical protein
LVVNPEGSKSLGRARRRWECCNKLHLKEEDATVQTGPLAGFCDNDDERADFIKAAEFVD